MDLRFLLNDGTTSSTLAKAKEKAKLLLVTVEDILHGSRNTR
ncbi:MAG TPA: hypothetical protein VGJ30_10980 [Candidatus Angelobacter sp.]